MNRSNGNSNKADGARRWSLEPRHASQSRAPLQEKWEAPLGIRLLGNTVWRGLSNHQAATAQMHSVGNNIAECPPLLGSLPPSLTFRNADCTLRANCRAGAADAKRGPRARALSLSLYLSISLYIYTCIYIYVYIYIYI